MLTVLTADLKFIDDATREFREALSQVVADHEAAGRQARAVLGDPRSFAARAIRASAPAASPWDELVGPFVRTEGVQARLGITRQAVAAKAARRRLLRTITTDGEHLYPLWQFVGDQVLKGLGEVISRFPESEVDGWTVAAWLRTVDRELGEAPLAAISRGDLDRTVEVAAAAARSFAA